MTDNGPVKKALDDELPFVAHEVLPQTVAEQKSLRDHPTIEEPLPPVLILDHTGHLLAYETKVTEVSRETTDDR